MTAHDAYAPTCVQCGRTFDLTVRAEADEWSAHIHTDGDVGLHAHPGYPRHAPKETNMTKLEALKDVLETDFAYNEGVCTDQRLQIADERFRAVAGDAAADRLCDIVTGEHWSATDEKACANDPRQLAKLAIRLGL